MQIVMRAVGRRLIVGLAVGGIAVGLVGCGTERIEPASLQELPPAKRAPQESESQPAKDKEDSGPPAQPLLVDCATVNLAIPDDWTGQQTGTGSWTFGAPDQAGELTVDGEYREGTDAFQDIAQLAAQLGWDDADTKTYGQGGIVIVGDSVETGTEWQLGMVVGEANQIVNLSFEYDTSTEATEKVADARNDVAKLANRATITAAGTCEGL